jgi:hypothetical protein
MVEIQFERIFRMADRPVVHLGENSPEEVAFKLMRLIGTAENKNTSVNAATADRKWVLDTYAECLEAVRGHRSISDREK